jgi:signal transduction histidine kinase
MPANLEITLYRIIQEILNNALKHSNAKSIDIGLKVQNNRLFLSISDDGVGFDTTQIEQAKGIGWKNIFSRISMLGGDIDVNSQKNMGSNINISLPI